MDFIHCLFTAHVRLFVVDLTVPLEDLPIPFHAFAVAVDSHTCSSRVLPAVCCLHATTPRCCLHTRHPHSRIHRRVGTCARFPRLRFTPHAYGYFTPHVAGCRVSHARTCRHSTACPLPRIHAVVGRTLHAFAAHIPAFHLLPRFLTSGCALPTHTAAHASHRTALHTPAPAVTISPRVPGVTVATFVTVTSLRVTFRFTLFSYCLRYLLTTRLPVRTPHALFSFYTLVPHLLHCVLHTLHV